MLVIGDESEQPRTLAWMTGLLILINVGVFGLQRHLGESMAGLQLVPREIMTGKDLVGPHDTEVKFELPPVRHRNGQVERRFDTRSITIQHGPGPEPIWLTLLTCMFLHADLPHLVSNMLFLLVFGRSVEAALRPWGYLLCYLICGVAGGLAFCLSNPHSIIPCVGASGAISGLMGAYIGVHPMRRIRVLLIFGVIRIPALVVVGLWYLGQYAAAELSAQDGISTGVAYMAHLGGFLTGLVLSWGAELYTSFSAGITARKPVNFDPIARTVVDNALPELATARFFQQTEAPRRGARHGWSRGSALVLRLLGAVVVGTVVAAAVFFIIPTLRQGMAMHSLTLEKFAAVRTGMSLAEVETVLGVPAGDYSGGGIPSTLYAARNAEQKSWIGPQHALTVFFDSSRRVTTRSICSVHPDHGRR